MSPLTNVILRILFGLAFAAAGLWCARMAVMAWNRRSAWRREGVVVDGEIVGFEEVASNDPKDRRPTFAPVVFIFVALATMAAAFLAVAVLPAVMPMPVTRP